VDEPLDAVSLTPAQERLAAELRKLDPELEGLYREGVALSRRCAAPGVGYLLAHAGRELSRGVVRSLSEGRETLDAAEIAAPDDERNRETIARVVELSPMNGVVTDWFRANQVLTKNCHYQPSPASGDVIAAAFGRLGEILHAVLAPFFHAKPEVDRLLTIEHPSSDDLASLKAILARRALRQRFFRDATMPGWLPALKEWGVFADPPERNTKDDGSWNAPHWVPGAYLVRVAKFDPETVTQIIEQIPQTNSNPAVWRIAADAALEMPAASSPW
jgi:hypothetical protein